MKEILYALILLLTIQVGMTQVPNKMSYQAVVRDVNGDLITNSQVGLKISVIQTSVAGTAVYAETHTPITNDNGLLSLEIGGGTVTSGVFADIAWGNDVHFIKTEIDPAGGTNYTLTMINQMLAVPYAMHAKTVEKNGTGGIYYTGDGF